MSFLPNSTFSSNSPQAQEITVLTLWVFGICALIFLIVVVWVGYSVVRFRHRGEEGEPDQRQINKNYEIAWTIIPTLICVLLGWLTVKSMFGPRSGEPLRTEDPDIIITGAQWWWDIRYPKLGVVAANELHLPVGRPFVVQLSSNDVIHTFWIPDLGRKQQMIPGHDNFITIQEDMIGTFLGACAQYCGNQHAWMRLLLVAQSPADFDAWVAQQKVVHPAPVALAPAAAPGKMMPVPQPIPVNAVLQAHPEDSHAADEIAGMPAGNVARGARIYQQQTCGNCHSIEGVSSARYAPDLSHIAGRATLGAGVLENNKKNLIRWIRDPQAVKPGCNMPNFQFTAEQTNDLVAYLETLQ
jgi:cytochrome c oxidase subunit 2